MKVVCKKCGHHFNIRWAYHRGGVKIEGVPICPRCKKPAWDPDEEGGEK